MTLAPGAVLGPYEIESLLGAGGMGVVYRAFDSRLQRPVAIKCLQATDDDVDVRRRTLTEARSASALNHPNICTIHDVAEHGDLSFIVMEYVAGRPLSDVIAHDAPAADVTLNMAVQIASALAHAHERNVVHGDLKTANVLVSESGQIKVVDFGLARRHDTTETTTDGAFVGGTPHAMAPEQLRGDRPDSRSDVWSLGVLLQELMSGTRPFSAPTVAQLLAAILSEPPTRPASHVPPGVRRIIERCLTRDPERRYQRAGEVLAALDAISGAKVRVSPGHDIAGTWRIQPPPALTAMGSSQIVLVGREEEWTQLRSVWERAKAGRRQLALVAGDPGIGKTRLVMEFARSIGSDATVLLGRCDQEALVPQQPFVEALEWFARECPADVLEAQLADIDGVWELAQLIAPIARRAPRVSPPIESNPEGRRYRLFEAVASLVSEIARARPLLIVLEDLHWADRPTILLLRHLLRSSHEAPLCLVATYRETDLGRTHPLSELLAELRREDGVTRIGMHGLGEAHVQQFIERWIGRDSPSSLTQLVTGSTEGNPFFLGEILRHLDETGALGTLATTSAASASGDVVGLPEGVRQAVSGRLSRLSGECNRVLSLAAVVGREFSLPVLTALGELREERLFDVIDEALAARLVQNVPGAPDRYAFTHALVRDTLYEELIPARRSRLHRQVAEALDRLAPSGDRPLADLAYHYARAATAADAQKAIECAVGAAERAAATFALEEAARFYNIALQALDLLPPDPQRTPSRFDLHFRRGRAFADLGLWGPARLELEAALPLVLPDEVTRRTELLLELSKCVFWLMDVPAVRRYVNEALPLAESLGREDLVADAMSWLAGALNAEGDVTAAVEMDRRVMARIGGPKTFGLARSVISLYHMGLMDEALQRAFQSVESARASQDPTFRVFALQHLAVCLAGAGRYAEASRTFAEMREFGRRHGVLPMLARGISMSAGIHIALGDYARGEELAHEARELARRISFPPPFVSAGIDLLTIFARSHEPGRADAIFDDVARAVEAGSGWHGWLWRLRLSQARAELALARGEWESSIGAATEAIADSELRSRPKYVALALATRATARKAIDDVPGAIGDASRSVAIARTLGDPAVLLNALRVGIDLDGTDALVNEARGCIERIVSNLDDAGLRERFLRDHP
jgi:tetratricopeptide (TPR) repeat protein/predicted Ser/Thr protein kinase